MCKTTATTNEKRKTTKKRGRNTPRAQKPTCSNCRNAGTTTKEVAKQIPSPETLLPPLPSQYHYNYTTALPQRGVSFSVNLDWFDICLLVGVVLGVFIKIKKK
ncbi:hypothetical protein [uncultured Microscilla sp.]|uniref:hypothetical protein n=1 Tax=uncultured Microscilla sp. TaxID=432653 RepID=UPI00260BB841|nr:hypothetical protein [uncultured Microscilla sp.]